ALCNYNNDVNTGNTYGFLYNWFAASDSRGLAPEGWHVATQTDWQTLVAYLGGDTLAGGKLKEAGTAHWFTPNADATNQSGFTALPGGLRVYSGKFEMMGTMGLFWTSTPSDDYSGFNCGMFNENPIAVIDGKRRGYGFAVRCVKN
ncbi:MAG: fibrobacter succinogenes major paralogous domain-containing protein, partial [Bacteroidota bacterium]